MSNLIKCDRCGKITAADSSGEKMYKISVDGFKGDYSMFDLCEWCLRSFYLDFLGWIYDDHEYEYIPKEDGGEDADG